jgi:hypothetical protein
MPKISCLLERGGKERLTVSWERDWKNTTLVLDDKVLGKITDKEALKSGRYFTLNNAQKLHVQLVRKFLKSGLVLRLNGLPLPDSPAHPHNRYILANCIVFFVGGLNGLLGFLSLLVTSSFFQRLGFGIFSIALGGVFIGLGFAIKQGSQRALILAVIIFIIDGLFTVYINLSAGLLPTPAGLIGRVFLVIPMIQGIKAMGELTAADGAPTH